MYGRCFPCALASGASCSLRSLGGLKKKLLLPIGHQMKNTALLTTCLLISACSAYEIRPVDPQPNSAATLLAGTVQVDVGSSQGLGEQWLAEALVEEGLASSVTPSAGEAPSDYLLSLESMQTGACFSEPMLTVLTLGLIPSVGCAETGYKIELADSEGNTLLATSSESKVTSVSGLAAWFLLLSPSWVGERGLTDYEAQRIVEVISKSEAAAR